MEHVTLVGDKVKGLMKQMQESAIHIIGWGRNSNNRSPIEILKRLQREAFSDIMKLRDRQEKVERMLTFYKSSKGSPFPDASTHVSGRVDVLGGFFFMDGVDEHHFDAIQNSGIRTGIDAKITFQSAFREKDTLLLEFMASEKGQHGVLGNPLSLAKVSYEAHFSKWFSAVVIPKGAKCRDLRVAENSPQETAVTDFSDFGPLHNEPRGTAIGMRIRKSNLDASFGQFVSYLGMQVHSPGIMRSLGTFGQIVWQLSGTTKLSLIGTQRQSYSSSQHLDLGVLALPVNIFNRKQVLDISENGPTSREERILDRSVALTLDLKLDESARIRGWFETKNSNPRCSRWSLIMSDVPEDEFGWGLIMGGSVEGRKSWDRFQVETFLNFNFGERFKLQPALVFLKDGTTQFPSLLLRSSWSL